MTTPKHYDTWNDLPNLHSLPYGTTYIRWDGQIRRWNATTQQWEDTDTPASLRADDPPWYREPTADKPGQLRPQNYPAEGWEWSESGRDCWFTKTCRTYSDVIEARRIEPEPATVTVMLEDLESVVNYIDPTNSVLTHWGILDRFRVAIEEAQA